MTLRRWAGTMVVCGLSLGMHLYCVWYVRSAWGLVSLAFLFVMAFRAIVDTVDLGCGRLLRSEPRLPAVRQVGVVRRIILEEEEVYERR